MAAGVPGRPRDADLDVHILSATEDLLVNGGLGAATVDAIAARAGVGKASIYRRWHSRDALILDALHDHTEGSLQVPDGVTGLAALEVHVIELASVLADERIGPVLRALTSRALIDEGLASEFRERWIRPRREVARQLAGQAIAAGELAADLDIDLAIDQVIAPLYLWLVYHRGSLDADSARTRFRLALEGLAPPGRRPLRPGHVAPRTDGPYAR